METLTTGIREVTEEQAEGKVKDLFVDIKSTLRVPLVNLIFRVLATYPDYLQVAWRNLKPNAQTVFFERQADALRQFAVEAVAGLGQAPGSNDPDVGDVLRVFHYINPKLLIAAGALRSATHGLQPRLQQLASEEKRQTKPGIPEGATAIAMVAPEEAAEPVQKLFADIRETLEVPVVNSDYRALARWPDYLERAWDSLRPIVTTPAYQQLQRELRAMTEDVIIALPYRMDLTPHVMRLIGLSEQQLDEVQRTLNTFYRLLPGLILNISFLTVGVEGKQQALESPFPPMLA